MNTPPEHGAVEIDGARHAALIFPLTLDGLRRKRLSQAVWFVPLVVFAVIYLILLIRIGTYSDATSNILSSGRGLFPFGHRPGARAVGDDHQDRHAQARWSS